MGKEEVEELAEEIKKEETEDLSSEEQDVVEEPETVEEFSEPPKMKESQDEKLLSEVVVLLQKLDEKMKDFGNRIELLEKAPEIINAEEKSFTEILGNDDIAKLDAVATINTQRVQIPKARVQEFLDKMRDYGVKISLIHLINTDGKGKQVYPEDELKDKEPEEEHINN